MADLAHPGIDGGRLVPGIDRELRNADPRAVLMQPGTIEEDGQFFPGLGSLGSPHVNDKVKLSEEEIQKLSPMRRPSVNKPLGIAYGTGELPAMIASSRDYHAYRSQGHVPGDLIPIANTNHFTILDELRQPNSTLTRAVIAMA